MTDDVGPAQPQPERVVTEERAWAKWQEVGRLIDALVARSDLRGEWVPQPGSSLAGDDRASDPYQVSHAVAQCLMAAIDHAHAVKSLVVEHQMLHAAAPASLARGFIESMATAFWLLHGPSRVERVGRAMKWHVRNVHDQAEAVGDIVSLTQSGRSPSERIRRVVDIATAAGVEDQAYIERGYRPGQAVAYADREAGLSGIGVLFSWRLCSGVAHGRPWAFLGMLEQERVTTAGSDVLDVRLTNDFARSLYPVLTGMHLTEVVLKLHKQRSQSPFE